MGRDEGLGVGCQSLSGLKRASLGEEDNGKLVTCTEIDQISKYMKDNGSLFSHS